jgi:hypothetical protein
MGTPTTILVDKKTFIENSRQNQIEYLLQGLPPQEIPADLMKDLEELAEKQSGEIWERVNKMINH